MSDSKKLMGVIEELRDQLDSVYAERNLVVALALKFAHIQGLDTWIGEDKRCDIGSQWKNVVFVKLPNGKQLSWHIHDSEVSQFKFLKRDLEHEWDGHTTGEKYRAIRGFCEGISNR